MTAFETQQEWESLESSGFGEYENSEWESGETEQFLGGVLGSFLGGELGSSSGEVLEMELAAELLEVSNEEELEQFLGKLISKAAGAVKSFAKSGVGKAIGGALKSVAKTALPFAAGALGNFIVPGVGGAIGSKLGSMATKLFEVEMEGLNEQEAEFEVARRYVRFATSAVRNAASAPRNAPPRAVARAAITTAARRHAPGLLAGSRPSGPSRRPTSSRWRYRNRPGYGVPSIVEPDDSDFGSWSTDGDDDEWDSRGGADSGPRSGRWIRRGRKIMIVGL